MYVIFTVGAVLSKFDIQEIIKFAYEEQLLIIADEVYQTNIYGNRPFYSFKKVINELGEPYNKMELCSVNTVSKGATGECGLRGGYLEACNLVPGVKEMLKKVVGNLLCPNILGQAVVDCVLYPPKEVGDPSYNSYDKEVSAIHAAMKLKAELISNTFKNFEGFNCQPIQAAMYAYPSITIPKKAFDAAKALNLKPDEFYCYKLLEATGICVVPGSGFGQQPGTYHFRTTILPALKDLKDMLIRFDSFHKYFMLQYRKK